MTIRSLTLSSLNQTATSVGPEGVQTPLARVLLIEDEPRLLRSLEALLQNLGLVLTAAATGLEAIEHLRQSRFDLVILDLGLPDIGGQEIMDFMILHQIDAHIVVTSGAPEVESVIGALKRGAYDYLRKPYASEELLKTIAKALQHRRLQEENRQIAFKLESSEQVYRNLVDCSPDIIYTLDNFGCFTFVNNRARDLLGYSREYLLGKHYSELIDDEDMERAKYVFGEAKHDRRLTRSVELRFKSFNPNNASRTFSNELMTTPVPRTDGLTQNEVAGAEIFGIYGVARDITDNRQADELISHQAYHDILTDLPNRVLFKDRLSLAMLQARRNDSKLAVMFIDLDRFKLVNESLGHRMGDELLQQTAHRLKTCLRRCDTLARFGDDEFTAILPELTGLQDATLIADKFLECMKPAFELAGHAIHMTASIGIAFYPDNGTEIDALIRNSGIAMYQIKAAGKNGHAFFTDCMLEASKKNIELEHRLHLAQHHGELEMHYQPQIDVSNGKIIGAEALMRWNHPERGLLSAGEFLPMAEDNGLIIPISDWMLNAICIDLLAWNATGCEGIRLSLNLSPQYLDRGDFYDKLQSALSLHNISPTQVEVEVTENICIRNPQAAIKQLDKLCQLGVSVAIDDFGTGYSSLSYLHRFPIHTLKIDRSFVMEIHDENAQFPVVLAIISIAKGLGLNLVAEGVETQTQAAYLQKSGCQIMQGYLYYKPLPQSRMLALLTEQASQSISQQP
jgi:diguanylate cyclase (GGDEF)-like protein/PAS domain S-box-containing protein